MLNSRDISLLRPDVAANCHVWQERCRAAGLNVLVTNTVRDREHQEYLYAQGRTRPGSIVTNGRTPTFHSDRAGLAFDFCKNVRGHEYDDAAFFRKAAAIAKEMGFSWGGDWRSFPDSPHIQWDGGGKWTGSMILAGQLPPTMPLWGEQDDEHDEEDEDMATRYNTLADCPNWAQETIKRLMDKGYLSGDGTGLDLSHDMVRLLVILDRAGALKG